jgi:hypothetical protein
VCVTRTIGKRSERRSLPTHSTRTYEVAQRMTEASPEEDSTGLPLGGYGGLASVVSKDGTINMRGGTVMQ